MAENQFTNLATKNPNFLIKAGSCANVALIVGDLCYVANVGDSRAILSEIYGNK